jgi:uncharacterized surface protein with fasciclin (FAS1) repeats
MSKLMRLKALGVTAAVALSLASSIAVADGYYGYGRRDKCSSIGLTRMPDKTIVDVAVGDMNDFSTLVGALQGAGLVSTLQGPGPFTVFAPTNAAFMNIPDTIRMAITSDTNLLTQVLLYHVVAGRKDLRREDETVVLNTVQKEQVFARITCKNGAAVLRVNNSNVILKPIAVSNGIIYVVDSVLLAQF